MNRLQLSGRLMKDPEPKPGNGEPVRMSIAVKRLGSKDASSDYFNCVAFDKAGRKAEAMLKKGSLIIAQGRLRSGSYLDKEGKKVYVTDIILDDIELISGGKAEGQRLPEGFDGVSGETPFDD